MRTFTKIALFGLAAAGLAWWLDARRRRQAPLGDDLATGLYRTSSVGATAGLIDDAYDRVADAVATDDLDIAGDLESLLDEDVGTTSRGFVDVERVYASTTDVGGLDGLPTPIEVEPALSAEEEDEGFRGAEAGESWLDAINVAAAEDGLRPEAELYIAEDDR